uniref:Mediator of RNA polymerase II transcription subunit 31 n=1 Tax=Polytomella parva TaxID=51329 RepID=A0A7S0USE9_9CHLO|mmetsp:Transcript_19554/g.35252  ORF Transcript_19554/g.35252 Transcript_19554/m.35252 type:complete len:161 (+) Transcript_19554:144-626(+)
MNSSLPMPQNDDKPLDEKKDERRHYTEQELGINSVERFSVELEFVQCLANPLYLNHLAVSKYFDDPAFVNYLKYLLYWTDPKYAQFIVYPQCLYFLEELQSKEFRDAIANYTYAEEVQKQQNTFFRNFWKSRMKEANEEACSTKKETSSENTTITTHSNQ